MLRFAPSTKSFVCSHKFVDDRYVVSPKNKKHYFYWISNKKSLEIKTFFTGSISYKTKETFLSQKLNQKGAVHEKSVVEV